MNHVYAYALLTWHMILHLFQKLFMVYRPGGIERVRDNFAHEGLISLSADERAMLKKWQSCIGCGLCEAACADLSVIPDNRHVGPQLLAQSTMRDLSKTDLALPEAEAVDACDCDALEEICPVGIPLCELGELLSRLGEETARVQDEH
jgi:succinate dehydrogenase/fumarate reductase-like Fe-S protein